jgi:hypothetical protein
MTEAATTLLITFAKGLAQGPEEKETVALFSAKGKNYIFSLLPNVHTCSSIQTTSYSERFSAPRERG